MNPEYDGRYPLQGTLAVLCEGDVAGYEKDLLEKWLVQARSVASIDVWPCGTKKAAFGMADALGRSVPILVIEDRDYLSLDDAKKACDKNAADRRRRAADIKAWLSWQRHEIENYLIEPDVLIPVLSNEFPVDRKAVEERLGKLIESQSADQAANAVLSHLRERLPDRYKAVNGLPRKKLRPAWNGKAKEFDLPSLDDIKRGLSTIIGEAKSSMDAKIDSTKELDSFQERIDAWKSVDRSSDVWKCDWSGKEVLHGMLQWMAGEYGWTESRGQAPAIVDWDKLGSDEAKAQLRRIESAVQPHLIRGFLDFLSRSDEHPIRSEWKDLADECAKHSANVR